MGHTPGPGLRRLNDIVMVDTAASYGGELSAYCPETRACVSVPGLTPRSRAHPLDPWALPQPLQRRSA